MKQNSSVTFADIARQHISFNPKLPSDRIIITLINNEWFQRLRDIKQTSNANLVYMFSEHSRFGHSIGVAHLTKIILEHLKINFKKKVEEFESAIKIAALVHDIGHLAPGSHVAFKVWFPKFKDCHEVLGTKIILEDPVINEIISKVTEPEIVSNILMESETIPKWCWQIVSGSGWNADRGNWCIVDSILAGVDYGKYNIHAIVESLTLSSHESLAFHENRIDAMSHFAISRQSMYRQVFFHRVLLSADQLAVKIAKRARRIFEDTPDKLFADQTMQQLLTVESPEYLELNTIFKIRESWWLYHLGRWCDSKDSILSDLSCRLKNRNLLKTVALQPSDNFQNLFNKAEEICRKLEFDPEYYLDVITIKSTQNSESNNGLQVIKDNGNLVDLIDSDPLFKSLAENSTQKRWLIMPSEVKAKLGRVR